MSVLTELRHFSFASAVFRLVLAQMVGAVIGYGRSKKQRSAGLRTYMLVCMGAALTILISLYESQNLATLWAPIVEQVGLKFDGTRYAAGVISGVGFLAAGTILGIEHQQVSGLTTAIGLFVTACLGLAAGAGFYEAVLIAAVIVIITMETLHPIEIQYKRRLKNITICVEYDTPQDLDQITQVIRDQKGVIFDLDREPPSKKGRATAIIVLRMDKTQPSHSGMLSSVAQLPCVRSVRELIS